MKMVMKKLFLILGLTITLGNVNAMNNGMEKLETKKPGNTQALSIINENDDKNPEYDINEFTKACDQNDLDKVKSILKKIPIPVADLIRCAAYCLPEDEPVNETIKFLRHMYYFLYSTTQCVDKLKYSLAKDDFRDFMPRRLVIAVLARDKDIVDYLIKTQQISQETLEQVLLIALRKNLDQMVTILNTKLDQLNPAAAAQAPDTKKPDVKNTQQSSTACTVL